MIIKGHISLFGKKKEIPPPIVIDTKIRYLIEHHIDIAEPMLDLTINVNPTKKSVVPIKRKRIKINYE